MKHIKKAPTAGTAQGRLLSMNQSYRTDPRLSMAGEIILLALQVPDHAERLRAACWDKLETTLRAYYREGRAGR